jgi:hypothetical protein
MINNLGEGYYGVEATGRTIASSVLVKMNEAYDKAMSIPDKDIIITEYKYKTKPAAPHKRSRKAASASSTF